MAKPRTIEIALVDRWPCQLGTFRARLVVRPSKLSPLIQAAIKAKGGRTVLAAGALEVRVDRVPMEQLALPEQPPAAAPPRSPPSPASPVEQLALLLEEGG